MTSISRSERSYIQSSLQAPTPQRADGRGLHDYRAIALETGAVPLANGSARVHVGAPGAPEAPGGTEVLAAVKLEVEDCADPGAARAGRLVCAVAWCARFFFSPRAACPEARPRRSSPAAYPHLGAPAMDDVAYDLTIVVNQTLVDASLLPPNLVIIPGRKAWRVQLDLLVISDAGNVYDALFLAARAALWDTKVPRTRAVEFNAPEDAPTDVDMERPMESGFDTRTKAQVTDFELEDYWDEGAVLGGRERWPVCVTMNLVRPLYCFETLMAESWTFHAATTGAFLGCNPPRRGFYTTQTPSPLLLPIHLIPSRFTGNAHDRGRRARYGSDEKRPQRTSSYAVFVLDSGGLTFLQAAEGHAKELYVALEMKLKEEEARRGEKARAQFANVRSRTGQ
jgi:exosome complex component RRP42